MAKTPKATSASGSRIPDTFARVWIAKTAKKNWWRVMSWYDLDDLIMDGMLCWQIVCTKYPHITERRHLMSLFQRTYTNHIHKLSIKRTIQSIEEATDDVPDMALSPESDDSDLRRLAAEQTGEIHRLLIALIDKPELLMHPHRRHLGGRRESTNEYLCSLIGIDPRVYDLDKELRSLLGYKG